MSVDFKRYGCKILLHKSKSYCYSSDRETLHYWTGFTFQQYQRWHWYFNYRAALAQIANPKMLVELQPFSYQFVSEHDQKIKRAKDKLTNKKGKLTQWQNKIDAFVKSWNSLFPYEQEENYKAAINKVNALKFEITVLEQELTTLINS